MIQFPSKNEIAKILDAEFDSKVVDIVAMTFAGEKYSTMHLRINLRALFIEHEYSNPEECDTLRTELFKEIKKAWNLEENSS